MIVIIDYNMGNLGSVKNMIKKLGYNIEISNKPEIIRASKKIILPGVGSFDKGIENLKNLGLFNLLNDKVLREKIPILGICLGMQLMTKGSEEGSKEGFAWINAYTKKFVFTNYKLKIPHMGWNTITIKRKTKFFEGMYDTENRFYFVHSYYVQCNIDSDIIATTEYGIEFTSAFEHGNIIGVQFHPEKSHKFGMAVLKNFMENY